MAGTTRPLRIAVAGVGSFTQRVILPGLAACADAEVVALFGPTRDKTERIAAQFGVGAVFDDYVELLAQMPLDAVFVATPNDTHHPLVMAALERGLAVACEKPLALTVAQAREMHAAATQRGVPTAVNFSYRSSTSYRQIVQLLASGELGSIYHFSILFLQGARADPALPIAWRMQAERGGGTVLDIGTHVLDLLRWWFGDIAAVCANSEIVVGERSLPQGGRTRVTADDTASCLVRLQNGVTGVVQLSQVAHGRQTYRHVALYGSAGSAMAIDERQGPSEVHVAKPGGSFRLLPPPPALEVSFDDYPAFHLARIVRTLQGEPADFPTFADGLWAQEAAEAVQVSSRERRWVELAQDMACQAVAVRQRRGQRPMATTELDVPDISCDHCAHAIRQALAPQPGIAAVEVDVAGKRVTVEYDERLLPLTRIEALLDAEGYPVESAAGSVA